MRVVFATEDRTEVSSNVYDEVEELRLEGDARCALGTWLGSERLLTMTIDGGGNVR
jgi:hypothetical protein